MRILIEILLPILLPALIYLGYVRIERRRSTAAATALPWWASTPWVALTATGVLLAALVLSLVVIRSGDPIGGLYVPAHMDNGQLVPGHVVPPSPPRASPPK